MNHSRGDSLTNMLLITVFSKIVPEGYQEPCDEVWSLSPAEHLVRLVGFDLGTS